MRFFALLLFVALILPSPLQAHRSGCHSKHSCPSDSGSYICGDKGYCSQCPDNKYCENKNLKNSQSEAKEATQPSNCKIKGNISYKTGEKIYHVPGGNFYSRTKINPSKGEKWFCSEEDAKKAGWRRSKR